MPNVVGRGGTVSGAPVEKRKCKLRSEVIPLCIFILVVIDNK